MSIEYKYTLGVNFPNGLDPTILTKAVASDPLIQPELEQILIKGDNVSLFFDVVLTSEEEIELVSLFLIDMEKPKLDFIHETIILAPTDTKIKNKLDWQDLGGVIVAPAHFSENLSSIKAQVTGQYKVQSGGNAQVNLVEAGFWNLQADQELLSPYYELPPTGDMWLPFTAYTNVPVRAGFWAYTLHARRNQAEEFYLRYTTLSIVEEKEG